MATTVCSGLISLLHCILSHVIHRKHWNQYHNDRIKSLTCCNQSPLLSFFVFSLLYYLFMSSYIQDNKLDMNGQDPNNAQDLTLFVCISTSYCSIHSSFEIDSTSLC